MRSYQSQKDWASAHPIERHAFRQEPCLPYRIFHLLERLQRIDHFLRSAQRRRFADPLELARLRLLKDRVKTRLARLAPAPA